MNTILRQEAELNGNYNYVCYNKDNIKQANINEYIFFQPGHQVLPTLFERKILHNVSP